MFFKTFHLQIDAIRSAAGDIEQVEAMVAEKKALLKNSKDIYEFDRLSLHSWWLGMAAFDRTGYLWYFLVVIFTS